MDIPIIGELIFRNFSCIFVIYRYFRLNALIKKNSLNFGLSPYVTYCILMCCDCSPPEELDSFVLNQDGFYYTSPIEWAASAIEMSILSAKNSALLAFNNWYGLKDRIDPTTFNTGREDL